MSRVRLLGGGGHGGNKVAGCSRAGQNKLEKVLGDCYLRGWHLPSRCGVGQGCGGHIKKGGENTRDMRGRAGKSQKNPGKQLEGTGMYLVQPCSRGGKNAAAARMRVPTQ